MKIKTNDKIEVTRMLIGDQTFATCVTILIAGVIVSLGIIMAGAILAATYLWQWPGFTFAIGAILISIVGIYLAAANDGE